MEINNRAEKTATTLAKIIKITGIIAGSILIIVGIAELIHEEEVGLFLIIGGLGGILSSIAAWALINVFVNISLKLDAQNVIIQANNIDKLSANIAKLLGGSNAKKEEQSIPIKKLTSSMQSKNIKPVIKEGVTPKVDDIDSKTHDEIDNMILGEILSGDTIKARDILISTYNISMQQANERIKQLKEDIGVKD